MRTVIDSYESYENSTAGLHDICIGNYKVRVIVSNMCDKFLKDILDAFREYFGFELYYKISRTESDWLFLHISDGPKKTSTEIIADLEDADYYVHWGAIILMKKDDEFYELLFNGNWDKKTDFGYNISIDENEKVTKKQLIEIIKKRYTD